MAGRRVKLFITKPWVIMFTCYDGMAENGHSHVSINVYIQASMIGLSVNYCHYKGVLAGVYWFPGDWWIPCVCDHTQRKRRHQEGAHGSAAGMWIWNWSYTKAHHHAKLLLLPAFPKAGPTPPDLLFTTLSVIEGRKQLPLHKPKSLWWKCHQVVYCIVFKVTVMWHLHETGLIMSFSGWRKKCILILVSANICWSTSLII